MAYTYFIFFLSLLYFILNFFIILPWIHGYYLFKSLCSEEMHRIMCALPPMKKEEDGECFPGKINSLFIYLLPSIRMME